MLVNCHFLNGHFRTFIIKDILLTMNISQPKTSLRDVITCTVNLASLVYNIPKQYNLACTYQIP